MADLTNNMMTEYDHDRSRKVAPQPIKQYPVLKFMRNSVHAQMMRNHAWCENEKRELARPRLVMSRTGAEVIR